MWKYLQESLLKRFAKRKKLYIVLIVSAFLLTLVVSLLQFFLLTRSRVSMVCSGDTGNVVQIDFYKDYSFAVINGRVYECQKLLSAQENVVLCLLSETERGYRSYMLYDKTGNKLYLAVGHRNNEINKDDCFLAGFAYASSFNLCVDTNAKNCMINK